MEVCEFVLCPSCAIFGQREAHNVEARTGACVKYNWSCRALRVSGSKECVREACQMIRRMIARHIAGTQCIGCWNWYYGRPDKATSTRSAELSSSGGSESSLNSSRSSGNSQDAELCSTKLEAYLQQRRLPAQFLCVTVDNAFADGDLHGHYGIIRASSNEECSVSFEDLCIERLIPWRSLLPVEPKKSDLARIMTGTHIGLTGTVVTVDDEEVTVHLKHGVVVCPISDLCKVR